MMVIRQQLYEFYQDEYLKKCVETRRLSAEVFLWQVFTFLLAVVSGALLGRLLWG